MDLPHFFPTDFNRRLSGLGDKPYAKSFKVVFQDFGRCGHVDLKRADTRDTADGDSSQSESQSQGNQNVYTVQRRDHKESDRSLFCADIPTIPLSSVPTEVHYPLCDDVIGDRLTLPTKVTRFSRALKQLSFKDKGPRPKWSSQFLAGKGKLEKINTKRRQSRACVEAAEGSLPPCGSSLLKLYTDLSQRASFQDFNARYSGGLLACVEDWSGGGSGRHLLFHATGRELDRLTLTVAATSNSAHVPPSCVLAERSGKKIFQVEASAVQDRVFVAARHDTSCSFFSVPKSQCVNISLDAETNDSDYATCSASDEHNSQVSSKKIELTPVGSCDFEDGRAPTSVGLSPYLPGEGVVCGGWGEVKLWSATRGVVGRVEREPRFACGDGWCQAYFAGHPRQVAMADRTAVQVLDHRDGFRASLDLFALPSPLLHPRERITAARLHGNGCPLHLVGTNHCLFVVDQRFGGSPVMQWYPDLPTPLMYLTSTDLDRGGGRRGVVLAGCQHPAEVLCYPFTHGEGGPLTASLTPWRLSRMSDISDSGRYTCFTSDPILLRERMGLSLAGLAVAKGSEPDSFLTYQADCYGQLFFQRYTTPDDPRTALKTGVPPPGRKADSVPVEVESHVNLWLERLQTQVLALNTAQTEERGRKRVPECRRRLFRGTHHGTETQTETCSLCAKGLSTTDRNSRFASGKNEVSGKIEVSGEKEVSEKKEVSWGKEVSGKRNILCGRCQHFHPYSTAGLKQTLNSSQRSLPSKLARGNDNSGYMDSVVSEGLSLLNAAVPSVESYEFDPFTSLHLELMESEPHLEQLIIEREEMYAGLLQNMRSKYHQIRERKNQKRQAERQSAADATATDDVDNSRTVNEKHSVFNTPEHHQQNSLINDVLSMLVKPKNPGALPRSDANRDSDGENTPPGFAVEEMSFDMFDDSDLEEGVQVLNNLSQGDDDEFFGSQDLFSSLS
ncbi:hypothetical protein ACOMHN_022832 [Nucella lapillus]